jgi:carboxymethylenebutenolidase
MKWLLIFGSIILVILIAGAVMVYTNSITPPTKKSPAPTNAAMLKKEDLSGLTTEDILYFEDTKGYYAAPKKAGNYPGVVMIHEWWGLNDHIKEMAQTLAHEGYHVIAVDLYNGKVAKTQQEAQQYRSSLNQNAATANMKEAISYLKDQGASKIASLGWCFGGGQSLQLALSGEPLDATVIYYGNLETDTVILERIKWPVLGIFGDKDQTIPVDEVKNFESALTELGIDKEIYIYPGVGHAFANPSGQNYAAQETKDAWTKTLAFLQKHLK